MLRIRSDRTTVARGNDMAARLPSRSFVMWLVALGTVLGVACTEAERDASRVLHVFAASSLTEAFEALAARFERAHPHVEVRLVFAGSQVLRMQIEQGAAADVFASANPEHVRALAAQGLVASQSIFAHNALVLAVARDNPLKMEGLDDLPKARRIVIGTPQVPAGRYARGLLARTDAILGEGFADRVRAHIVSEESNVRLVRAKVELGEADAALVYRTDALSAPGILAIELPPALRVLAAYPMARLQSAPQPELADTFMRYTLSQEGQAVLRDHGFLAGGS